jgi:hypothetical protein
LVAILVYRLFNLADSGWDTLSEKGILEPANFNLADSGWDMLSEKGILEPAN